MGPSPWSHVLRKEKSLKKLHKKLMLHRETLVDLSRAEIRPVVGGFSPRTCPQVCDFSNGRNTCTTCNNQTCTTNLC
jgi:hypothetical protein